MEYTADQLVTEAHDRGFKDVTNRLVIDWVQKGLIDKPAKIGRGSGGGRGTRKGTWPQFQRGLFLQEVEQHHKGAKRIATLCNLPVFVWQWSGDGWVPLRQVRRAMDTYSKSYRTSSMRATRDTARELARDLGNPGGTHAQRRLRQDFIDTLARMGPKPRLGEDQRLELVQLARRVFDPELQASPLAQGLAEGYVQLIDARQRAIAHLRDLTDEDYYWARHVYVMTRVGSAQHFPQIAADPALADRFEPPTREEIPNRACIDLLTIIGLVELSREESDPIKGAAFDPRRSPYMASYPYDPEALKQGGESQR